MSNGGFQVEDMERYGDYNDAEEEYDDGGGRKNPLTLVLKIVCLVVCLATVGIVGYRIFLSEYTPDAMKNIAFTDELSAYYEATGGAIGAKTQSLRFSYDDEDAGTFFADHLIVIEGVDHLQITLRYNLSTLPVLAEKYKMDALDTENNDYLSFRLRDNYGRVYDTVCYRATEGLSMYRFVKLAFDDVELHPETDAPEWIRLEILVGENTEPFSYILVYENNVDYHTFTDYKLSRGERP